MSDEGEHAAPPLKPEPVVRSITPAEILDALAAGLRDFRAAPQFGLFFGAIYAFGGLFVVWGAFIAGLGYLAYPAAAGFALLGPFVAVGLYEVSRRREAGLPLAWGPILSSMFAQSAREFGWMAFVTLFIFVIWMYQIRMLLAIFLGFKPFASLQEFVTVVTGTPEGLMFLAAGHIDGAVLSLVVFSLTVVSFPLLLERDVDFVTAMITSVRAVTKSPGPMLAWGVIVVALLVLAIVPAFAGLPIVLPVLGHTTWHLYRRLVAPEAPIAETTTAVPDAGTAA